MYGPKFTSSYGLKPNKSWREGLGKYTPEEIGGGLRKVIADASEWPPNLMQFMNYCQADRDRTRSMQKRLPAPKPDPEIVEANLKRMREIIGS